MEYVKKKPDERDYFIDPDKYRNPDLRFKNGESLNSAGKKSVRKVIDGPAFMTDIGEMSECY